MPNPLAFNFDECEFKKGNQDFMKRFNANMQKENSDQSPFMFRNFYYEKSVHDE